MSARDEVLGRIRAALDGSARPPAPSSSFAGGAICEADELPSSAEAALFAERLADYQANVTRCTDDEVPAVLASRLVHHGAVRVIVPAGFPARWTPEGISIRGDDPPLSHAELDAADGVLTTAAAGIAESGTLVLDGGDGQGRRALTLLPDLHVCVIRATAVVATVGDTLHARSPITFISGPSATSDIGLERVEGVHGPRRLEVVLVG